MKRMRHTLPVISLAALLSTTSVPVLAADSDAGADSNPATGLYLGGHYGRFSNNNDEFDKDNDFYDVVIGGLLTPYFGLEGSYSDFGKLEGDFAEADLTGYGIAGLIRLPIGHSVGIYAKAGQFFWRSDINVTVLGQRYASDIEGEEPFYGVGVDFFVTRHFNIGVEYLRYQVDLSDSDLPDAIDDYETEINTAKVGAKLFF